MSQILLFFYVLVLTTSAWACKVAFPNELICESGERVKISAQKLQGLKKSLSSFYNKRDRYIDQQQKNLTPKQRQKTAFSSCFNLRHSEMYANFLIQVIEKNTTVCKDHVQLFVSSVEQVVDFKSEENTFIRNQKQKTHLLDQSVDITAALEALKMETLPL